MPDPVAAQESRTVPASPSRRWAPVLASLVSVASVAVSALAYAWVSESIGTAQVARWLERALVDSGTLPALVVGLAVVLAAGLLAHAVLAAQAYRTAPALRSVRRRAEQAANADLQFVAEARAVRRDVDAPR